MRTAEQINDAMTVLSDRLNHVTDKADPKTVSTLNALLSDWQDFYWSQYEQWPVNDLQMWDNNANDMSVALTRLETAAGTQSEPIKSAPATPGKVITLAPTHVIGTWPTWMKVGASAILAFLAYKAARKLHIL